jgi:hypothetical protein
VEASAERLISLGMYAEGIGVPIANRRRWAAKKLEPPRGYAVDDAGQRAQRIVNAARSIRSLDPRGGFPTKTCFTRSEEELRARVRQGRDFLGQIAGGGPVAHYEREDAERFVWQHGGYLGYDLLPDGLGYPNEGPLTAGAAVLGSELRRYHEGGGPTHVPATQPVMTMSGGWDFGTGLKSKLMHGFLGIVLREYGLEEYEREYAWGASLVDSLPDPHAIIISRSGPLAKWFPMYEFTDGGVHTIGEMRGFAPRRRHVYGVSTNINVALLAVTAGLKWWLNWLEPTKYKDHRDIEAKIWDIVKADPMAWELWSDDLTKFDQYVRSNHQDAIYEHIYKQVANQNELAAWRYANRLGVLGAPWSSRDGAFMYTRPDGGCTTSGLIGTNVDGSLINLSRVIQAVAAVLGVTEAQAWAQLGITWFVFVTGDDTMLLFKKGLFDEKKYMDASAKTGLLCKLARGGTFKKRMYEITPSGVRSFGYSGRYWAGRCFPEHGKMGPATELIGAADAYVGAKGNPFLDLAFSHAFQGGYWGGKVTSPEHLMELAASRSVVMASIRELKNSPARQRAFLGPLEEHRGDMPFGAQVAAALLGQPGTLRFNPETIAASASDARIRYREMANWIGRRAPAPYWYKEVSEATKAYQLSSEAT